MSIEEIKRKISLGENIAVEFKRCGNGMQKDVYETVCSFSNRFGGDIFCGVLDDGAIEGIPEGAAQAIVNNFVKTISNEDLFQPKLFITPEIVLIDGKLIIHIHVPFSSELCRYKKEIYDRIGESDVIVKSTSKIVELGIRKQNVYTEQKVFPFATISELNADLIERARRMAVYKNENHPWKNLSDMELLRSARLFGEDLETGKEGINLAGLLLFGRDDVIGSACPSYKTDAILKKVNTDRYDDRQIISTNLIDSFDQLVQFGQKHLWDKFHIEGMQAVSLRDKILREMISNILMHREYVSPYVSRFIIEEDRMYTENPCKALDYFKLTPDNFTPVSKNPIIASFFVQIGNADELGSGIRNLFKYTKLYSGEEPTMIENDIFKTEIPLNNSYSADANKGARQNETEAALSLNQQKIIKLIKEQPQISAEQIAKELDLSSRTVERNLQELKTMSIIERVGSKKDGRWVIV